MLKEVVFGSLLFVPPCERPPVKYQGDAAPAVIMFAPPEVVDRLCGGNDPRQILACTNIAASVMLMPDPCLYADGYGALLCHEKAHLNRPDGSPGWSWKHS